MDALTLDVVGILTLLLSTNASSYAETYAELYTQREHSSDLYHCCQSKMQQMSGSKFLEFLNRCKEFDHGSPELQRVFRDRNQATMARMLLEHIIRFN